MRVLLVFFGDDYHGGTTHSTVTIARGLVRRGHDVHALARVTHAGTLAQDLRTWGVTVHDVRAPILVHPLRESRPAYRVARLGLEQARRIVSWPAAEAQARRIIRECGIDLVSISSGAIATGARAARGAGVPYVWHAREFMEEDHGLTAYPWAHIPLLMEGAASVVCVSRAVEAKVRRDCPNARTQVVYNGIDTTTFNPNGREVPPEGTPLRLMTSGGLRHSKGTFLVLDALAQLGQDTPLTLDVFGVEGGGADEGASAFLALCEGLGLGDRVSYRGVVGNMADQLRAHDVQVVASRAEAFGRVTAEAMLCGCTVVGSDSGGTPELVDDGRGYLFEAGSAASLARALRDAADHPEERVARAGRALAYARENFSADTYVDKIEAVYLEAVQRTRLGC